MGEEGMKTIAKGSDSKERGCKKKDPIRKSSGKNPAGR